MQLSKDDILGISDPLPAPEVLTRSQRLLKPFIVNAHSVVTLPLELINEHLQLPHGTLANMHRLNASSGDQLRFIKSLPQLTNDDDRQVTFGEHTDFGSLTLVFNRPRGLQILPPGKYHEWCYVRPLPGHAVVNFGDAMAKFSNRMLHSNIHRIMSPPGAQAKVARHSLVYLARPENEVILKRLENSTLLKELPPDLYDASIITQLCSSPEFKGTEVSKEKRKRNGIEISWQNSYRIG